SHIAPIKKSVAAYFSKYAGKTALPTSSPKTSNRVYTPSRWWGCSREVKEGIKRERAKYVIEVGVSDGVKILKELQEFLNTPGQIKSYTYDWKIGGSKSDGRLGGGRTQISYYVDIEFARMQTWEKYIWEDIMQTYGNDMQTSSDATQTSQTNYADMGEVTQTSQVYYKDKPHIATPPHPLLSQPSKSASSETLQGVRSRTAYLANRARLLQYLSGGDGERGTPLAAETPNFVQGELFPNL
ncbi:MAG: hypothetical protein ACRCYQ_01325, partial [Nocardioides sp.]